MVPAIPQPFSVACDATADVDTEDLQHLCAISTYLSLKALRLVADAYC